MPAMHIGKGISASNMEASSGLRDCLLNAHDHYLQFDL